MCQNTNCSSVPLRLVQFVSSGGLQLLLEIFNSGILEPEDQESWTVVSHTRPVQQHSSFSK